MNISITDIDKEAEKIIHKIKSGELIDGCSMSAIQTPTTEAWERAQELTDSGALSPISAKEILSKLDEHVQSQLVPNYDDFDLIYERLLQLITR
jgi:hypothetical protein